MPSHAARLVDQATLEPTAKLHASGYVGLLTTIVLAAADQLSGVEAQNWWQAALLGALMWTAGYLKRERSTTRGV